MLERHERREAPEAHVLERHERSEATVLWVDAHKGSCDFFFSFLYWVYVQMLVGGACGGYCTIV